MTVIYRVIANDGGTIELSDLCNENTGKYYKEPSLNFTNAKEGGYWDNENYILNLFQGLKKGNKEQKKELKEFCKVNDFNYKETRGDLLDIFKQSKKLKYFKR